MALQNGDFVLLVLVLEVQVSDGVVLAHYSVLVVNYALEIPGDLFLELDAFGLKVDTVCVFLEAVLVDSVGVALVLGGHLFNFLIITSCLFKSQLRFSIL